ncbi:MAG: hypothetical protein OCC46_13030 [Pseudodesulfovibrio sp.]
MSNSAANVCITLDQDWAPDWASRQVANLLIQNAVKATWFITHQSELLDVLRLHPDLFELGIHPNCLPGSTQGENERDILTSLKALVPEATSIRSHSLYQHSRYMRMAAEDFGFTTESNTFLPFHPGLQITPHHYSPEVTLYRAPVYWADDYNAAQSSPIWKAQNLKLNSPGLKVLSFHPIHIVLNTAKMDDFRALNIKNIKMLTQEQAEGLRVSGHGTRTLFEDIVSHHGPASQKISAHKKQQ